MSRLTDYNPHLHLTFHEAIILTENLYTQDKASFISHLSELIRNTTDPSLIEELKHLTDKLLELTDDQFAALREAVSKQEVVFPPNFSLTHSNIV